MKTKNRNSGNIRRIAKGDSRSFASNNEEKMVNYSDDEYKITLVQKQHDNGS